MKKRILIATITSTILFIGCATPTRYVNPTSPDKPSPTLGIDETDFRNAASDAVESMLRSGAVSKRDGSRYVLAISTVINDTTQRLDVDQLIKKIRIALLQSGKVVVTTAVKAGGAEDKMSYQARTLRDNKEFNQATVAGEGQMIAPDLSLSGKIIQRNSKLDSDEQRVDYYFQLTLTDIKTGLAFWEGETVVGKVGSGKSVSW